jgi:hypothetical protein
MVDVRDSCGFSNAPIMNVGSLSIVLSTATALLFMQGREKDLTIRGAFLHRAADALVPAGAIAGGWQPPSGPSHQSTPSNLASPKYGSFRALRKNPERLFWAKLVCKPIRSTVNTQPRIHRPGRKRRLQRAHGLISFGRSVRTDELAHPPSNHAASLHGTQRRQRRTRLNTRIGHRRSLGGW